MYYIEITSPRNNDKLLVKVNKKNKKEISSSSCTIL